VHAGLDIGYLIFVAMIPFISPEANRDSTTGENTTFYANATLSYSQSIDERNDNERSLGVLSIIGNFPLSAHPRERARVTLDPRAQRGGVSERETKRERDKRERERKRGTKIERE
jgi:hypothetical protein